MIDETDHTWTPERKATFHSAQMSPGAPEMEQTQALHLSFSTGTWTKDTSLSPGED